MDRPFMVGRAFERTTITSFRAKVCYESFRILGMSVIGDCIGLGYHSGAGQDENLNNAATSRRKCASHPRNRMI